MVYKSILLNNNTSQYHDFAVTGLKLNNSMTSNTSLEDGVIFSFSLNDVQDLRSGSGY